VYGVDPLGVTRVCGDSPNHLLQVAMTETNRVVMRSIINVAKEAEERTLHIVQDFPAECPGTRLREGPGSQETSFDLAVH
jgi:hypothetical protein